MKLAPPTFTWMPVSSCLLLLTDCCNEIEFCSLFSIGYIPYIIMLTTYSARHSFCSRYAALICFRWWFSFYSNLNCHNTDFMPFGCVFNAIHTVTQFKSDLIQSTFQTNLQNIMLINACFDGLKPNKQDAYVTRVYRQSRLRLNFNRILTTSDSPPSCSFRVPLTFQANNRTSA